MNKKYKQLVAVEPKNSSTYIDSFVSDSPITMEILSEYYENFEGFDWDRDSISMVNENETIDLDDLDVNNDTGDDDEIEYND